ncbi:hypothetical protein SKAU_G00355730 [Synaphobranchus kaupii]|uniref:non-specific serine/threonine protein kinase n=1 Tax=Synaphobranchus kaupii TaxID=118154 RepID=A0A9Q1EHC3_SYNKA|nr:hypothetical protein SKAU_G00355730 [Synaphobranchus kaupii]
MPKWQRASGSRRGPEQEIHQTCGDNPGFSSSKRNPYRRPSEAPEQKAEGAVPQLHLAVGQNRPMPSCGEEVVGVKRPEEGSLQTPGHKSSSLKSRHIKSIRKAPEQKAEGAVPQLHLAVGQKRPMPSCGEEVVGVKRPEEGSLQTPGHKSSSLKSRHIKSIRKAPEQKAEGAVPQLHLAVGQNRPMPSCGEEVVDVKRPEEGSLQTPGHKSSSLKTRHIKSIRKAPEQKAEGAVPQLHLAVGQNRPMPSCGEEVVGVKRPEEGSLQTPGHKSSSLKSRHIKSIRKARVETYYTKGALLGRGGFGSVYAGTRMPDGLPVALKYAKKLEDDDIRLPGLTGLPREVALLKTVNGPPSHPNVLRLYDWFDRPSSYLMVMERPVPCQDLAAYCKEQGGVLRERDARDVTRQLLGALEHCHQSGVVHRDVKPQNILIKTDTQQIKLIDFGCGDPLKDTPYEEFSGTKRYQPPEWFAKEEFLAGPGTVWSVGVTLYQMVCGKLPFTVFNSSSMQQVQFPEWLSPGIVDFIGCCLRPQVEDRPTLGQLHLHPWLH